VKQKTNYWGVEPLKFNNTWNIKPIKTFDFRLNFDTDKDGVKDWKDCKPFDWRRQDKTPSKKSGQLYDVPFPAHKQLLKERLKQMPFIKIVDGYGIYAWKDNGKTLYEAVDMRTGLAALHNRESVEEIVRDIKNRVAERVMEETYQTTDVDKAIRHDYDYVRRATKEMEEYGGRSKRFKPVEGQRVLDVGAGSSPDIRATHAIDLRKPSRKYQKTFPDVKYEWDYDFNKETTNMPYSNNYFNVVVSYGALGRNFWSENVFSEIYRVLKPNGHFELHATPATNKRSIAAMKSVGFKNIKMKSYYNESLQEEIPVIFAQKV